MSRSVFGLQSLRRLLCGRALFYRKTLVVKCREVLQPAVSQQKRPVSLSAALWNHRSDDEIVVHFIDQNNQKLTAVGKEDERLLEVVKRNLNIDGFGVCEGTLSCATCHLILNRDTYESLDEMTDEELDMLDLALELTSTSRLGCQICLKKSLDGITVKVPSHFSAVRMAVNAKQQS
ncbi:ferredoxin 1b [Mobula birostris]|uniref:ferredoxin 1b n=1 Tax=Mobula birostris TaxID=1983395 RepID=UPI003B27EA25